MPSLIIPGKYSRRVFAVIQSGVAAPFSNLYMISATLQLIPAMMTSLLAPNLLPNILQGCKYNSVAACARSLRRLARCCSESSLKCRGLYVEHRVNDKPSLCITMSCF